MLDERKQQVTRFYERLWNARDNEAIASVLHEDVAFRGSLGVEKRGHDGFAEYVATVHEALAEYRCTVEELVAEGDKVFAKVTFDGIHRNTLLGYPPSGKRVWWQGCALFAFEGDLIANVWVLGDLAGLESQLRANSNAG